MPRIVPACVSPVLSAARAIPKSAILSVPSRAQQQVLRLHVAVDEPGRVRVLEAAAGLEREPDGLVRRQPPALVEQVGERLAVDVLHDDVGPPVRLLAGVVDADDVRVRKPCRQPRLAQEPPAEAGVAGEALREQLHGDRPVELGVAAEVDRGHPAVPERT